MDRSEEIEICKSECRLYIRDSLSYYECYTNVAKPPCIRILLHRERGEALSSLRTASTKKSPSHQLNMPFTPSLGTRASERAGDLEESLPEAQPLKKPRGKGKSPTEHVHA